MDFSKLGSYSMIKWYNKNHADKNECSSFCLRKKTYSLKRFDQKQWHVKNLKKRNSTGMLYFHHP